jgi:hypothetical protein
MDRHVRVWGIVFDRLENGVSRTLASLWTRIFVYAVRRICRTGQADYEMGSKKLAVKGPQWVRGHNAQ